jgi:hypothetical protein
MASMQLPLDFSEFLRSLNSTEVDYLLIGGYAVGYYGYPRYTGDIDVWVRRSEENAGRLVRALRAFGFDVPGLSPDLFLGDKPITRLGNAPIRIEILTEVSGVDFDTCFAERVAAVIDDLLVPIISLPHLLENKRASGRHKDLEDVQHLERIVQRKQSS